LLDRLISWLPGGDKKGVPMWLNRRQRRCVGQGGSSVGCGGDFGGGCGGVGCGGSKGFGDRRGGKRVVEMIGYDVVGW